VIALSLITLALGVYGLPTQKEGSVLAEDSEWEDFHQGNWEEAIGKETLFVDFTASWCITCQVNKKMVLEKPEILAAFAKRKVRLIRADWTDRDESIARFLAKFDRSGVPLYLLYPAGQKEPIILPELLSTDLVQQHLDDVYSP
jgi:thiol:disulfide interchange protein DsbD